MQYHHNSSEHRNQILKQIEAQHSNNDSDNETLTYKVTEFEIQ